VKDTLKNGSRFIAPLWSLENFVAVNAYMGMADMPFEEAMQFMSKSANTAGTLPISFYLNALKQEKLTREDIAQALEHHPLADSTDVDEFLVELYESTNPKALHIHTLADIANQVNGKKWSRFMVDRISFWASAYFDQKQASWDTASAQESLFMAWKREAEVDYASEVMGLKGFRKHITSLPDNYLDAVAFALDELEIPEEMMQYYLNSLLMKMNGWAGFAARIDWDAKLEGKDSNALQEFLAILIVWEMTLKKLLENPEMQSGWELAKKENLNALSSSEVDQQLAKRLILQQAFDLANQRTIIKKVNEQKPVQQEPKTPKVQAVFCIDVRSEVLRRNIEAVNTEVETLGFAGFFAFPVKYVPLGYEEGTNQCPALITTSHTVKERVEGSKTLKSRLSSNHLQKALKAFKQGAISCFGFVSPLGLFFLPKLLSDALGLTRPQTHPGKYGLSNLEIENKGVEVDFDDQEHPTGIPLEDRIRMAGAALKAMSLTSDFAPVVLITGHGSSTTNNPHGSGLDCGACGGNSGEANAKVAAAVLNDHQVRTGLREQNIDIPDSTLFVAALHDTTTDEVKLFKTISAFYSAQHEEYLEDMKATLRVAGAQTRAERAHRMGIKEGDIQSAIMNRSKDWSQVRPEWGLAGCSSFIVAPRKRTSQLNLGGKTFMHNYSWQNDKDFSVLELIMTAPMVVTSWINLNYYASTVDNKVFGAGNKTLHNVVGGVGVLEGFAGDLRAGLPMQSVHDGSNYQHEPQRLNVIIEAPVDEMSKILSKHESIRNLCDNQWIYLFAMNDDGKIAYKYEKDLQWKVI
jgi:hypothetical protein